MRRGVGLRLLLLTQLASCSALYSFDDFRFDGDARPTLDAPTLDAADAPSPDTTPDAHVDAPSPDATPDVLTDVPADVAPCALAAETRCANICVDTQTDARHCGTCGHACDVACARGACVTVTAIQAGDSQDDAHGHTCALMSDQTVRCWGSNTFGELGDGTTTRHLRPTEVPGVTGVVQLAVGGLHTCVRRSDGAVLCWGDNTGGAVGVAATVATRSPVVVPGITAARGLSAGAGHTCVVTAANTVRCWGDNFVGQCGVRSPVSLFAPTNVPALADVTEVSAGGDHTCALHTDRSVDCWGMNSGGQLGDNSTVSRSTPGEVPDLLAQRIVSGNEDTCVVNGSGQGLCWGVNRYGLSGNNRPGSTLVPSFTNYRGTLSSLSVGSFHACFLGSIGLWCAGLNTHGQLGNTTTTNSAELMEVSLTYLPTPVLSVSCGYETTCAVLAGGAARCWGRNAQGQLGDGTTDTPRALPMPVLF